MAEIGAPGTLACCQVMELKPCTTQDVTATQRQACLSMPGMQRRRVLGEPHVRATCSCIRPANNMAPVWPRPPLPELPPTMHCSCQGQAHTTNMT